MGVQAGRACLQVRLQEGAEALAVPVGAVAAGREAVVGGGRKMVAVRFS